LVALSKHFWTRVLVSVVIQLYAGECTPSVDRALILKIDLDLYEFEGISL